VRTLGVDLASSDERSACAVLAWTEGGAELIALEHGFDPRPGREAASPGDLRILALAEGAHAIGIDAPFGWPGPFHALLGGASPAPWSDVRRDALRFRRTDFVVREVGGFWPLSVSSDLVALPALRCQGLLAALGVVDRASNGRVFEVYPRLGLTRWGLDRTGTGYKGKEGKARRAELVARLASRCPWLALGPHVEALRAEDHALDALLAALLARAAARGLVEGIPDRDLHTARDEGWIVVPLAGSLDHLPR
jgi:hypothetical protein